MNRTTTSTGRFGRLPCLLIVLLCANCAVGWTMMLPVGRFSRSLLFSRLTRLASAVPASSSDAAGSASASTTVTTTSTVAPSTSEPSIAELCKIRNLPLQKVKNARDLASADSSGSKIKPGRVFRMGRLSEATQEDIQLLLHQLELHTLVDLRSPTELKDDRPGVLRQEVFDQFTSMVWKESSRRKQDGCVRELTAGEFPVKKPFWSRRKQNAIDVALEYDVSSTMTTETEITTTLSEDELLCDLDCEDPEFSVPASQLQYKNRRERHFVSLMNELKYVRGTLGRVRKRDTLKAVMKAPGALVSSRVRTSVKEPFLRKINQGGLLMLNELLLRYGAPGIKYVLDLCADRQRHPVGFYCTAGKDRTGMITAIILSLCGVDREDIVRDYSLSANVYAEMNDHQAMVGALSQRSLDPKTFLGAPASVMRDTLELIDKEYGSVEGYCTWMGFGPEQQEKLRKALMEE